MSDQDVDHGYCCLMLLSDLSRILCWIRSCCLTLLSDLSRILRCWIRKCYCQSCPVSCVGYVNVFWRRRQTCSVSCYRHKCWCEFSRCFSGMKTPHYCFRTVYEGISPEFCSHRFYPLILIWMWNVSLSWDLFWCDSWNSEEYTHRWGGVENPHSHAMI